MISLVPRRYVEHWLIISLAIGLVVILELSQILDPVNVRMTDALIELLPQVSVRQVTVISLDDQETGPLANIDRGSLVELVDRLAEAGAAQVMLDVDLAEVDFLTNRDDPALVLAVRQADMVYLPVVIARPDGQRLMEVLPHPALVRAAKGLGHVNYSAHPDGQVRGVYLRAGLGEAWWPHVALTMRADEQPGLLNDYPSLDGSSRGFDTAAVRQHYRRIPFARLVGIQQLPASALERADFDISVLAGHSVFVGLTGNRSMDDGSVGQARDLPRVMLDAATYAALRENALYRQLSAGTSLLLSCLLVLPLMIWVPRLSRPRALLVTLLQLAGVCLLTWLLAVVGRWLFSPAAALVAAVLVHPLWSWRSFAMAMDYLRWGSSRETLAGQQQWLFTPASVEFLVTMVERVLPVESWRLTWLPDRLMSEGGQTQLSHVWQGSRARHYTFRCDGRDCELTLVWTEESPPAALEQWLGVMVSGCEQDEHDDSVRGFGKVDVFLSELAAREEREQRLSWFLQASLESLHEGVLISDACGRILYINAVAINWLGLSEGPPDVFAALQNLILPQRRDSWSAMLREAIVTQCSRRESWTADGREICLDVVRSRSPTFPTDLLTVTIKDISDLKQVMRSRGEMLNFLSHDLRSPLVSLLSLSEKHRADEMLAEPFVSYLRQVESYARKSLNVADHFLLLARAETLEPRQFLPLDMLAVVESAVAEVADEAANAAVQLIFSCTDEDVWVAGDFELLEKAVTGLLQKALSLSFAGAVVKVKLAILDDRVSCSVVDHGETMPVALQQWLGQEGSAFSPLRGAGPELRLLKTVVERHGGVLEIASVAPTGNSVMMLLPRIDIHAVV